MTAEETLDHYQVLGLSPKATRAEIRKAFKSLSQKFHPDKNSENEDHYRRIKKAYDTLWDPEKKSLYDGGIRQGFRPEEFRQCVRATLTAFGSAAVGSLAADSIGFGSPHSRDIKFLLKSFLTREQQEAEEALKKNEQAEKRTNKALKRIKKGKDTLAVKAIREVLASIQTSITNCKLKLAAVSYIETNGAEIEEEPETLGPEDVVAAITNKNTGRFEWPPTA